MVYRFTIYPQLYHQMFSNLNHRNPLIDFIARLIIIISLILSKGDFSPSIKYSIFSLAKDQDS